MISSPSLRLSVYAADEGGDSGGDSSNDGGGSSDDSGGGSDNSDSGSSDSDQGSSSDDNSDSDSNDNTQDQEVKDEEPKDDENNQVVEDDVPHEEAVPDNDGNVPSAIDAEEGDSKGDNGVLPQVPPPGSKGTSQEQEKTAVEDYVNEEPGIKKPYPPVTPPEDICKTHKDACDKPRGPPETGPHEGGADWCKQHPDKCDHPGNGGEGNWCKEHPGRCDGKGGHEDDEHHHHHNWCDHHDCHHHNHHSSTHFSDSHNGDVTVKVNLKYKEKNSKNLDDVELIIGDVYDKILDLSDKPDTVKVNHLDIDGGDDFAVCLANEDSQEGECTVTEADNDHDSVEVWLDVK